MIQTGSRRAVTLFLCGDVMIGRGIDQVLPCPVDPRLYEPYVRDAREYVVLAERRTGPIPRPVNCAWIWGDALEELRRRAPDFRLVNLETAITDSLDYWEGKGIHYRMHPANLPALAAAGIDVCCLANNHVLDWGHAGLIETLQTLERADIRYAGAGRDRYEAEAPAVFKLSTRRRVLVIACGVASSGIPAGWTAGENRPGVNRLPDLSAETVRGIARQVEKVKEPGDLVLVSIHWGGNWGFDIPAEQVNFAHRLIDEADVDLVHGHSSHHVKGIEVYRGKLVLYGCGDFITDYEGIGGYEEFRGELGLMYFPQLEADTGHLLGLELVPTRMRNFRVTRAAGEDRDWLLWTLNREGKQFGTRFLSGEGGILRLECQ